MEIKNRFTDKVIFKTEAETLQEANLWGADLRGANLEGEDNV